MAGGSHSIRKTLARGRNKQQRKHLKCVIVPQQCHWSPTAESRASSYSQTCATCWQEKKHLQMVLTEDVDQYVKIFRSKPAAAAVIHLLSNRWQKLRGQRAFLTMTQQLPPVDDKQNEFVCKWIAPNQMKKSYRKHMCNQVKVLNMRVHSRPWKQCVWQKVYPC